MCVFGRIQFTNLLIKFVCVRTNQLFGCTQNVNLTWQTCGEHLGKLSGNKCQELVFYFSIQICYMFPISNVDPAQILVCA